MPATPSCRPTCPSATAGRLAGLPVLAIALALALLLGTAPTVSAQARTEQAPPLLRAQAGGDRGIELVPSSGVGGWTAADGPESVFGLSGDLSPFGIFSLPAGSTVTIEFDATVDNPLAAGVFTVGNQSTITSAEIGAPGVVTDDPDTGASGDATLTNLLVTADLTASKVDVPASGTTVPGNSITYSVVYGNDGPAGVLDAPVGDTFAAPLANCNWSCAASATGNCDTANGAGDIATTVDLEVGGTATFTITCDVDPAATGSLANTATIAVPAMVTEVDASDNSATDTNSLTPQGDLSITKTTPSAPVTPGATETYQVVVANSGPSTASGVQVSDVFPAGSYSNVTWTCSPGANSSCTAGPVAGDLSDSATLAPGESVTYTITVDVAGDLTGTLANTASLTVPGGFTDTNPGNESDTVTDNLAPEGDLSVAKTTLTSPVVPGGTVDYQVVISNAGPSTAVGALVTDTFAATLSGVTWTCSAAGSSSCASAGGSGNVSETVDIAADGAVTFSISATVEATASGTLDNTASVTPPAGFADATDGNDSSTVSDALVPSGDVVVSKTTLTSPVVAGQPVAYQIVVTNGGPSTLTGATVQDNFPVALTNESWTCTASPGSSCTAGGNGDILDVVTLLANGTATYSVTADLAAGATGTLDNVASVSLPRGFTDSNPANDSDATSDAIQVVTGLSITKTDGVAAVPPGGTLTYTVVVANAGPSTAVGATVADVFPAELSGVSWTCVGAGGGTCTAGPVNGDVNDLVTLPPTASVTYTASGTGNSIGTVSNTATVAVGAGATDPSPGDNSATDETFVGSPADVSGTKTVSGDTTLGGTVLYTVTLINSGSGEQLNNPGDEFVDVLPAELTLVDASVVSGGGGVSVDPGTNTVTWNGAIPVGGTVVIEIEATVNADAACTTVSNQGEIRYDLDGDGSNEETRLTDDPQLPGAEDPTTFQAGSILDIPTLSPLGVGLLVLLLAGLGLWRLRRRGALAAGLALVLLVGLAGAAGAQTTVDDFSTAQAQVSAPGDSTADGGGIVGGERDLQVTRSAGAGAVTAEVAGGALAFEVAASDPVTRGQVEVTWDGNDDDATALDPTGLGGVDLTATGQSGLRFDLAAADAGVSLLVEVFTDAGNSSRAGRVLDDVVAATPVYLPFSDFVVAQGSGADFTNVGAVRLRLIAESTTAEAAGATLEGIATAAPALVAAKVDLDTSDNPLGATPVAPGGTIRYRVTVSNTGSQATAVDVNDLVDSNTTVVPGTIRATPVPVDDSYEGIGNVTLVVPAVDGLLANDVDPDGGALTIDSFDAATVRGGAVSALDVNTGAFTYEPPAGFRGVDSFTYTVIDGDGNTATATAWLILDGVVWFVDSDNDACDPGDCGTGTSADPFETLDQAEIASQPGDWIRLRDGADDLAEHDTGIVLKDGQNLIGEGVALVIGGQVIEAAGLVPELTHAGAGGHGIVLTGNHEVRGLEVDGANGTAITGSNLGTVVLADVVIEDTDPGDGGAAVDLDTVADLTATFGSIQSNGSATGGIRLNAVAGTFTVNGTTQITDPVDHGIRIEGSPGLLATFTGAVTVTDAGEGGPDAALHLANNAGATVNVGVLNLDTENGDGLFALNGGTLNLTSPNNVINAVGGAALDIQGTTGQTGGTPDWTFQSLASTGSPDHGVRIGDLAQDLLVADTVTVLNADQVGILVQNAAGRSVGLGDASVTDDNIGAGANGNGIDLATGNAGAIFTFATLNVVTDGGFGVLANNSGIIEMGGTLNVVNATGGAALDLTSTGLAGGGTFTDISSSGSPGSGVRLSGVTGTLTALAGAISSAAGVAFDIFAGNGPVTYDGTISNTASRSVEVTSRNAGAAHSVSFGGQITDSGMGILLDDNDVATLNFTGGLDLDTGANPAFSATNGGTLNVTQDNIAIVNTVDNTSGVGVTILDTALGASGVTFRRVSVNGAASGIRIANAGAAGGFHVVGNGALGPGITANNQTGGVIQNTTDDGVRLTNVGNVNLRYLRIQDAANHGIDAQDVDDLTVSRTNLISNGDGLQEHGLRVLNGGGTIQALNVLGDGNFDAHLRVFNQTGNDLTLFRVHDSTLQNVTTGTFEDGISFEAQTGVTTALEVTDSTFANHDGDHVQATTNGSTDATITLTGNVMTGAAGNLGAGITVNSAGSYSGTTTFDISNNDLQKANDNSASINVNIGTSAAGGSYSGTIANNVIGTSGNADSAGDTGVTVQVNQDATMTVAITGNTIFAYDNNGISVSAVDGTGTMNATVTGNTVISPDSNVFAALFVDSQTNNTVCLDAGGAVVALENDFTASAGFTDVAFQTGGTGVINLEGYGGAANDAAAIESYIQGRNTGSPDVALNVGGGNVQGGGACPAP